MQKTVQETLNKQLLRRKPTGEQFTAFTEALRNLKDSIQPNETEEQAVLDKANEIVGATFKFRELFNGSNPEYQIMNWDCGWYQVKALAKEYGKNQLDEFNALYKALADKMRPKVYTLGFLK